MTDGNDCANPLASFMNSGKVSSGHYRPLNDPVTVKEGFGLFCIPSPCALGSLHTDHPPWDLEGKRPMEW